MKITKTKLRQIIKEELDQHLAAPGEKITKAIKAAAEAAAAALTAEERVMDALSDYIEDRLDLGHEISVIKDELSKHIEALDEAVGLHNLISAFIENY